MYRTRLLKQNINMEEENQILDSLQIDLNGNFDQQLEEIFLSIRMSKMEVINLQILHDDLQKALAVIFRGCEVKVFGSIVMGLGLVTSDIDCFIANCKEEPVSCIKKSMKFFKKNPTPFRFVFALTQPKVPIVQLVHYQTGRLCDISFNSPLAVEVGELFSYLLKMDSRALHLAVLIKYWSKLHEIGGKNRLANYALTILVIFFLQYKRILPSIASLQEQAPPTMTGIWNTAFVKISYKSDNVAPIYQLVGEFFAYYSNYNFADLVVSPYLGSSVERSTLVSSLPHEYQLYGSNVSAELCQVIRTQNCPMCVQDPFDHSKNVAVAVWPKLMIKIKSCFKSAFDAYENSSETSFLQRLLQTNQETLPGQSLAPKQGPQDQPANKRPQSHRGWGQARRPRGQAHRHRKQNRPLGQDMVFKRPHFQKGGNRWQFC